VKNISDPNVSKSADRLTAQQTTSFDVPGTLLSVGSQASGKKAVKIFREKKSEMELSLPL
jgi:hypothetical protein